MITIQNKIDKATIQDMPRVSFPGKIYVIDKPEQVDSVCRYLSQFPILGIDSETRPSFKKGQMNKVALLQISTHEVCYLFRLNMVGITLPLIKLLENASITKVGLSLKDDTQALRRRTLVNPAGLVDLQTYVRQFGIEDMSLQRIYAGLFKEKISKAQQLSNWEADILTEAQQQYGAIDAWACLKIYDFLEGLRISKDYHLVRLPEPQPVLVENKEFT